MNARFVVVIPARLASERLPEKPLADVAGKPLVVRCLERARESGAEQVIVAVDHARIAAAVEAAGGDAQMTSPQHASGTDRLAEVAAVRQLPDDAIVVNFQGDEPLMPAAVLARLAQALVDHPRAGIATAVTPITDPDELFRESVVKAVLDREGFALYFSRAPIPWARGVYTSRPSALPDGVPALRHLGLYAYRVATLRRLAAASRDPNEAAESLEQLRALGLGIGIHVTVLDEAPPPGVDTPEDLEHVRAIFRAEDV